MRWVFSSSCRPFSKAARPCIGGLPGVRKTTSSVISRSTAVTSPAAVARCQPAMRSRILRSSAFIPASLPLRDPLLRGLELPGGEVLDLGRDEVGSQTLADVADGGIGDDGDLLHALVMVPHEANVGRHRAQAVPAGKFRRLEDDAGEAAGLLDVRIDRLCELREILLGEGGR